MAINEPTAAAIGMYRMSWTANVGTASTTMMAIPARPSPLSSRQ